jgi:GST-like protein
MTIAPVELYAANSSNSQRAAIMLEECGIPYRVRAVDLAGGEQRGDAFLAVNPAGAVPVMVDPAGPDGKPLTLAQSGAILLYLATKSGRFLPQDPALRAAAFQWFMFATTDIAGASGMIYFCGSLVPDRSAANVGWVEDRLTRYFRVANARLESRRYLADELSIADFALYPVVRVRYGLVEHAGDLPHLARWSDELAARPGVARGIAASE